MSEFYYLSDISERDRPWDIHRFQSDQVSDLYLTIGYEKYASRVHKCSEWLLFALSASDEGERQFRLQEARFCRVRHCPTCQWRESMAWKARFYRALPAVVHDYPTARWVLLTLTVRNVPVEELRATITHMNQSFKRLTVLKAFPGLGWVKTLEVTKQMTEENELYAHPHFHVLIMVNSSYFGVNYITQERWTSLWKKCLRVDYTPIVDIRAVKKHPKQLDQGVISDIKSGIKEVFKYAVKPDEITADSAWLSVLTRQLHKVKAVSIGGCLRAYMSESDVSADEMIQTDEDSENVEDNDPKFDAFWKTNEKRYRGKFRSD